MAIRLAREEALTFDINVDGTGRPHEQSRPHALRGTWERSILTIRLDIGRCAGEGRRRMTVQCLSTDTTTCEKRHQAESSGAKQTFHRNFLISEGDFQSGQ